MTGTFKGDNHTCDLMISYDGTIKAGVDLGEVQVEVSGKTITVSCYEKRYNYHGEAYYARFNGIQSKQRKRVLDWAEGMPMDIRKSVWSFFGVGGRQYGKVAEL